MKILSNEEIMRAAPSVFAAEPWDRVSTSYAFIPTIKVVEGLHKEGFEVTRAMQSNTRIPGKKDFTKHLLRFRHRDYLDCNENEIPELVLINSHDRTSSYQLSAGIFRVACSNGTVVKTSDFGDFKVYHTGNVIDNVIEGSARIINDMPAIMDSVHRLQGIKLTEPQQLIYAKAALELRYPSGEQDTTSPIGADQLLRTRRSVDRENNLWTTFNVVQENFMKGGLRGTGSTGRRMSTRSIKSVTEDTKLNKALWYLTDEMSRLAA